MFTFTEWAADLKCLTLRMPQFQCIMNANAIVLHPLQYWTSVLHSRLCILIDLVSSKSWNPSLHTHTHTMYAQTLPFSFHLQFPTEYRLVHLLFLLVCILKHWYLYFYNNVLSACIICKLWRIQSITFICDLCSGLLCTKNIKWCVIYCIWLR